MSVNVYENIIHKDLIETVKGECRKMHSCSTKTIGPIRDNKYTTFWIGRDDEPTSFIEYIVKNISIQDHPNGFPSNYSGIEWWSQVRDTKEDITFHYDKDEGLASDHMIMRFPKYATVMIERSIDIIKINCNTFS